MVIADNKISEDQREISAPKSILKRGAPSFGKKKRVRWAEDVVDVPVLVVGTNSWPALSNAQTPKPKNHGEKVSAKGEDVAVFVPSVGQAAPRAPSVQKSNGSGNFNPMNNMPSPHYQKPGPKRNSNTNGTPHFPVAKMPYHKQLPHIAVPYPNGANLKPVSPVAAGQESLERRRKTIYITRHCQTNLNERVSLQDPSEHSMEQQQLKSDTNLNKVGRAFAKLTINCNENKLVQAESVPEESRASKRVRRERINWEEDEDKLFLKGLKKHGKGRWKDISKEFVVLKSSTQVASHAEKRNKRRCIHDTTLNKNDTSVTAPMEQYENPPQDTATSRQMQLVLLCPIGSTLPDMNKLEKMCNLFNLLAKVL